MSSVTAMEPTDEELVSMWEVAETVAFIASRAATRVALQFPDDLLPIALRVESLLATSLRQAGLEDVKLYVLADTTYNSSAVDEVAAAHVDADLLVHYGRASLSPTTQLPALCLLGRRPLCVAAAAAAVAERAPSIAPAARALVVLPDQGYSHAAGALQEALLAQAACRDAFEAIEVARVAARVLEPAPRGGDGSAEEERDADRRASHHAAAGLRWALPEGVGPGDDTLLLWLGPGDAPGLAQAQVQYSSAAWAWHDPEGGGWGEGVPEALRRLLKRRYYLVEKARNASIVGIVVGTLSAAGHVAAVAALRRLVTGAGKKCYTFLVGKPNPAKLGNFPEVDVFVVVADAEGQVLDARDYYAPLLTPHEAVLAFSPASPGWDPAAYRLDFEGLLEAGQLQEAGGDGAGNEEPRFSLLDGRYHGGDAARPLAAGDADAVGAPAGGTELQLVAGTSQVLATSGGAGALVQPRSAAEFLQARRSWKGLEAPIVGAPHKEASLAQQGRSGWAAAYRDEPAL